MDAFLARKTPPARAFFPSTNRRKNRSAAGATTEFSEIFFFGRKDVDKKSGARIYCVPHRQYTKCSSSKSPAIRGKRDDPAGMCGKRGCSLPKTEADTSEVIPRDRSGRCSAPGGPTAAPSNVFRKINLTPI